MTKKGSIHILQWVLWGLTILFYFYEFLMRVAPSVMIKNLMFTFSIDAEEIGFLSGLYFYIYAPMQLPVGILMDRYGARRLLPGASFIVGLGGILFGIAPNLYILSLGRLLVGFGSAFAFVGMLYVTTHWFRRFKVPLLIGCANSVAMLGAVMGEGPLSITESLFGWRLSIVGLGIMGIILSLFLYLVTHSSTLNKQPHAKTASSFHEALSSFKQVVSHKQTWLNAFISFFLYATTTAFAALWGVPFLEKVHGLRRESAAFATSLIFIGWIIGGPINGHLFAFLKQGKLLRLTNAFLAFIVSLLLVRVANLPNGWVFTLLLLIGIFSSSQLLTFHFAASVHSDKATGSALAFTNCIVMLGGALFQPFIGIALDYYWSGETRHGIKEYATWDWQRTMTLIPLTFLIAFVLLFFVRKKKNSV